MPKEFSIFNNCIQVGLGDYGKVTAHILDFEPSRLDAEELVRLANLAGEAIEACEAAYTYLKILDEQYHAPVMGTLKAAIAKAKGGE